MALYKNGSFVEDAWRLIREGEDAPPAGHVILPLDWWLSERDAFVGSNAAIGVQIEPGADFAPLIPDLPRLSLVALTFPKFTDGRNFSVARLLRERYGFRGELRAVGEVLWDQMQAMIRCGFDAFQVEDAATLAALHQGRAFKLQRFYQQPAVGGPTAAHARGVVD